jgi:hypothetical protein
MSDQVRLYGAAEDVDFETARSMIQHSGATITGPGQVKIHIPEERSRYTGAPALGSFSNNNNPEWRKDALLTYDTMKLICVRSSAVAPAVNFVCETLGGTPFLIKAIEGTRVPQRDIKRATELFTQPMGQGNGAFPELLTELCFDQMSMDHGVIMKHGLGASMQAFEAMAAETFHAVPGRDGRLQKWIQRLPASPDAEKTFAKQKIVQFRRRPRTDSLYGRPPMEAVLNEVTALLNASKMFSYAMDRNEIPPGVLVMINAAGGGDTSRRRFLQQLQQDPGFAQHYRMRVLGGSNLKEVKWIDFSQNFHEMEVAVLMREIQAIVWRNFGVDRLAMGAVQDINRSTAEAMVATRHYSLFKPILDLWANKFTYEILAEINPNLYIEFIHYARTGDDADLQDEGGQGDPIGAPTGQKVDKDNKKKEAPDAKACFTCKGDGWINYKDEGTRITDQCPSCRGRGRVGPLFISRPHRARVIIPAEPQRLAPTDPDVAWASFGDPRQRARLDEEVLRVQERLATRLESVDSYDDLVSVGRFVRNQLMSLYDMAYDLGSKVVTSAGRKPNPRPLREARCSIMEVVRFELQETAASVLKMFKEPGNDGVSATAERALVSASHLASFAPRLAGQVIACQFE